MKNLTEKQKNQIDLILSGYTYYRNTGKRWSKKKPIRRSFRTNGNGSGYRFC